MEIDDEQFLYFDDGTKRKNELTVQALFDRIKELSQENAALKKNLDLCSRLQPMDTAPDRFVGYTKEDDECLECYIVYRDGDGFDTNALTFIRKDDMIGWTPLPEGTEGL